jgi:tetratricopeptide (TPR) repeat protein
LTKKGPAVRHVVTIAALVVVLLSGAARARSEQAGGWVGQQVITAPGAVLKIGRTVVNDPQREAGSAKKHNTLVRVFRVKRASGPWLWLESPEGIKGWVQAAQVMPCDFALDQLSGVLRATPNDGRALLARGILWTETKQYDKAIADFNAAARLDPSDAVVYYNRAEAWCQKKDAGKTIADLNEAIRLDPKYAVAFLFRSTVWLRVKQNDVAIADADAAIRLDPRYAVAYSHRALVWCAKGEFDRAMADVSKAIRLDPWFALAYQERSALWLSREKPEKAIADLNEAIRLDPDFASNYNSRGIAWTMSEKYDKAIANFDEAIRRDPKYAQAYYQRGYAWYMKSAYKKAIADSLESTRLDPENAAAYALRAHIWATCPDALNRRGPWAVEAATRACDLTDWKKADHLKTLAEACAEAGDFEAARKWQSSGLELTRDPEDVATARERLALYQAGIPYHEESDEPRTAVANPAPESGTVAIEGFPKVDLGGSPSSNGVPEPFALPGREIVAVDVFPKIDLGVSPASIRVPEPPSSAAEEDLHTVARVGADVITLDELNEAVTVWLANQPGDPKTDPAIPKEVRRQLLEDLIDRTLLVQSAKRELKDPAQMTLVLEIADKVWRDEELAPLLSKMGVSNEAELITKLTGRGRSLDAIRASYRHDLVVKAYLEHKLRSKVIPSESEMRSYYADHRADFHRSAGDAPFDKVREEVYRLVRDAKTKREREALVRLLRARTVVIRNDNVDKKP